MRNSLFAAALATAGMAAAPAFADHYQPDQAVGSGNWFIDAAVGPSHILESPFNDHPTSYAVNGGYRWKVGPDMALSVEAGYNDLGNMRLNDDFTSSGVNQTGARQKLRGFTVGVNGHLNVWKGLYGSGRTGVYLWKGDGIDNQKINRNNLNDVSPYVGVGLGYDFNNHYSLGLSYDFFKANKNHVMLTSDMLALRGEYRF